MCETIPTDTLIVNVIFSFVNWKRLCCCLLCCHRVIFITYSLDASKNPGVGVCGVSLILAAVSRVYIRRILDSQGLHEVDDYPGFLQVSPTPDNSF